MVGIPVTAFSAAIIFICCVIEQSEVRFGVSVPCDVRFEITWAIWYLVSKLGIYHFIANDLKYWKHVPNGRRNQETGMCFSDQVVQATGWMNLSCLFIPQVPVHSPVYTKPEKFSKALTLTISGLCNSLENILTDLQRREEPNKKISQLRFRHDSRLSLQLLLEWQERLSICSWSVMKF